MSVGPDTTTAAASNVPAVVSAETRQATALAGELLRMGLVAEPGESDPPDETLVTCDELTDLTEGMLTRTEIVRLQRLMILEMVGRGTPLKEIGRRLGVSSPRLTRLMSGILCDGLGEERIDSMRQMEGVRLDKLWKQAQDRFRATGKAEFLAVCKSVSDSRQKLFGLPKPVPMEVKETKNVNVRLQVVSSREEWQQIQAEQARLESAAQGIIDAEMTEAIGEEVGDGPRS